MSQHSPEVLALSQLIDTLQAELEESCWFENHAYTVIELLEGVASGEELSLSLQRMVATTECAIKGARGIVRLLQGHRLQGLATSGVSQELVDELDRLPYSPAEWIDSQGAFPGECAAALKPIPPRLLDLGIRACWSAPLGHGSKGLLGIYTLIFTSERSLTVAERRRLERAARLLGLAVERHQLQTELRQSEEHFRHLVVDSQVAICRLDEAGQLVYANPAWFQMTGLSPDCYGRPLVDLFSHQHRPCLEMLLNFRRQAKDSSVELALGERRILVTGGSLEGGKGSLESWVDVTQETRLQFLYSRLAAALEQSSEGVLIVDSSGQIEYCNAALTRALGFTTEELQGLPLQNLFTPDLPYPEIVDIVERTSSWVGILRATRRCQSKYVGEAVISRLRPLSGAGFNLLVSCRDVTREKELEEQVRLAQKMEAIGLLAGGVAHDFNNLLQAIGGSAALCQQADLSEEERQKLLDEIIQATVRAGQLTRQLLSFARKQPTKKGRADLSETVERLLPMLERLISRNIVIAWCPCPTELPVSVDPSQIEQVLLNLCLNARDAMNEGGRLEISVCASSEGNQAILQVRDNGKGIEAQHLPRLFEPFFTTKSAEQGTGLGLAVVYGIVQTHEGSIDVSSQLGQGTTFQVMLPLKPLTTSVPPPLSNPVEPAGQSKPQVLVVDDEPKLVDIARKFLERSGYCVLTAGDGVEAEKVFRENQDTISAVMMDLIMPRRGGLDTWKVLESLRPGLPILFCSGYMRDAHNLIPEREHIAILSKPYSLSQLAGEMRRILAGVTA
ncbi:PAS domain S-box protein [bacterium]|nr:PAS domain S-box protein [bacterium]